MNINNYNDIALKKLDNKKLKTLVLAILSGMILSIAGAASTVASSMVSNYSVAKLLGALVFPMGLILIIFMKTELFTGNSLMVIPLLDKKAKIKSILRNWILVYIGNFIGSILIALLLTKTSVINKIGPNFASILDTKMSYTYLESISMGFMCNFLVCMAVYLSTIADSNTGKILLIFIPIFLFIILSFEHSVANMFYLTIGYINNDTYSICDILLKNLLPVTIGNLLGGTFLGTSIWYLK